MLHIIHAIRVIHVCRIKPKRAASLCFGFILSVLHPGKIYISTSVLYLVWNCANIIFPAKTAKEMIKEHGKYKNVVDSRNGI